MFELNGKYAKATIFTDYCEPEAQSQIIEVCNQPFVEGSKICIMPDVHAGKGCTIGTTMTITDKVCPNLVGVDIGCGVLCINLGNIEIDFAKIDEIIRKKIPAGFAVHSKVICPFQEMKSLACYKTLKNVDRLFKSLGTLGGGNHFIEIGQSKNGDKWLFIHTGSRNLGKQVAEFYQDIAYKNCNRQKEVYQERVKEIVEEYKAAGRQREIEQALKVLKNEYRHVENVPKDLCYLEGKDLDNYLKDVRICQMFADENRKLIAEIIIKAIFGEKFFCKDSEGTVKFCGNVVMYLSSRNFAELECFTTMHNYIDHNRMILRKGAVSAEKGEKLVIPMNMRDGTLICAGKGNADWNYSAPHGAGRLMSRSKAKEKINFEDYKKSMEGIFTTSVDMSTIDESPFAYKPAEEIKKHIQDTVVILDEVRPLYNFKAGGE